MYNPVKPYKHEILRLIESTWKTPYVRVESGIYPVIHKKFSYAEVHHADGIGTKGAFHSRKKTFRAAVLDALAMNLNDMAMAGATPYALMDHIVIPDEGDTAILEIVRTLSAECKKRKIAIVGGETSHHDTADGVDIGITVSGFIQKVRRNEVKAGDILIGLKSSGLHSNGFTKVRSLFGKGEWREDFTRPTAIYLDTVLALLKKHRINGMMHITGGAFSKLKDVLGKNDAYIEAPATLAPQKIFHELHARGVSSHDMYATFNCGIGFVLSVRRSDAAAICKKVKGAAIIGEVKKGKGNVFVVSAFDGKTLRY